jgi:hypothetical protein
MTAHPSCTRAKSRSSTQTRPKARWHAPVEILEKRSLLSANITQFHYDPSSTGQNLAETVLTPTNVNSTDFGRQFITPLDGQVYAQPLAVQSIDITRVGSNSTETTGVHNVLYVATMHDSLFAIDADTGAILWQDSFLQIDSPQVTTNLSPSPTAGVIPFPDGTVTGTENAGINANDIAPEEGVFGTPVIDPKTDILYCIAYTQERRNDTSTSATPSATGTDWHFVERLWAINLADGSVAIQPTVPAGAPVPASQGQTIADTALYYTGSSFPSFSSFTGYEYFAGPYIKASGDNGDSADSHNADTDGWVVNPYDLTANSSHSVFAGTTPYAQGDIALNAVIQPTRTGLMLLNGTIYFGMTSHGDDGPYYGWVLGYSDSTLQNNAAFVTTPTWENYDVISGSAGSSSSTYDNQGAIWGGEQAITTDGTYLYMSLGNGAFDWTSANFPTNGTNTTTDDGNKVQLPLDGDYGNATIKLAIDPKANQGGLSITSLPTTFNPDGTNSGVNGQNVNGYGMKVTDFFVASNMIYLNYKDLDVGSGGVLLLPSTVTSTVPGHVGDPMLVTGGKEGRVYLIDRDNMGGFNTGYFSNNASDTTATYANGTAVFSSPGNGVPNQGPDAISYDRVLGEYEGLGALFTIPSFYMNGTIPTLVVDGNGQGVRTFNLNTFQYTTSSLPANDNNNPAPLATTSATFANHGSTSAISANGSSNPIVWNIDAQKSTSNDDLLAFNLNGMSNLYTSGSGVLTGNITNDTATKFSVPSVFNGMVYVGIGAGWGSSSSTQTAWAQGAIVGFGLQDSYLTSSSSYFSAPTALSGRYISGTGVSLTWTRNSSLETETEIDRSTNGTIWSVLAYVSNGASAYTDTTASSNTSYYYRVRVLSGANTTAYATSAAVATSPPTLSSAVSRQTQGTAGTFDIPLPLTGSPGVEDRAGGPSLLVLSFAAPITEGSNFAVTLTSGSVSSTTISGSTLSIAMSGATDGQTLVVQLTDVRDLSNGASGTYSLDVGVLEGDVNGDGVVNATDVTDAKLASGQPVTSANFRDDILAIGAINSADITITKLKSGDTLAPPPAEVVSSPVKGTTTTGSGGSSSHTPITASPSKTTKHPKKPPKKSPKRTPKQKPTSTTVKRKVDSKTPNSSLAKLFKFILNGSRGTK